jgi:hypothetical protein
MKKFLLFLWAVCSMTTLSAQTPVGLTEGKINTDETGNDHPRGTNSIPSASIDGYTFYVSEHPDYVLQLVDPDDETIVYYQSDFPAEDDFIVLPSTLSGTFEIRLIWGYWYLYGEITL